VTGAGGGDPTRPAVFVIIPARGGSKGIPRKNLRALGGRPLIAYAIGTALESRHEPDVYVSSDDPEIVSVATKLGARIHRREPALADEASTLDEVVVAAYPAGSRAWTSAKGCARCSTSSAR
jgi:CMP-N-acetylneuraminic acid synthetase